MPRRVTQVKHLLFYISIALTLMAAIEWFKYGTKINYEWFHCRTQIEFMDYVDSGKSSTVRKIWSRGGPSCDKRGEFKTIVKRISRDYEPNDQHLSFCIIENEHVKPVHYPVEDVNEGDPGYYAYVGYDEDKELVEYLCGDHLVYHI
ncbi:hypothetical protein TBLA_0C06930 [Henningerozyma blattae CBS 6284]|uniref:Ceramide synthase subunit LIP1 n=1 Tax=Henningerozyma blattae (strain ATCC 34711 / CBS 6284 / DSM 70876 / NBRC 10599 / NRRL Y-10934 / UCD 77-7) TaxID=1071380 RepID=I2H283_HENB6|nr:hypothetical protein TBLA_0C06930 [Tetrapisispora blattae CBS 6284]CCH60485.1 hypothetical protein TBLA_0C06930 [Tetrapisispora blattae CBS 6284]